SFVKSAQPVESCAICEKLACRCQFVPCVVPSLTRLSGKRRGQVAFVIFSRIRLMQGPMCMDARGLTQRNARQSIPLVGRSGSPLTSGKFVCTIGIQPTLGGKNV